MDNFLTKRCPPRGGSSTLCLAVGTAVRDELAARENSSLPLHLELVSFSYQRKLRPLWADNRLFVRLKCSVPSSVSPHRGTKVTEIPRVF